jgi:hypothetical protein
VCQVKKKVLQISWCHGGFPAAAVRSRTHPGRFGVIFPKMTKMRQSTRLVALILEIFSKRTTALIVQSYGPLNFFPDLAGCALAVWI